jgi:kumamolisin
MATKAIARFSAQTRFALPGSEKKSITAPAAALSAHPGKPKPTPPPAGAITVSVVVRRKTPMDTKNLGKAAGRLSRAEFTKRHGPDMSSVKLVKAFAKEFGLTAELAPNGRRTVHLTGTASAMQKAFGVELKAHTIDGVKYRVREGSICLPQELSGHVEAVLGLDNRPQAQPQLRWHGVAKPNVSNISYTPPQVAALYGFPAGAKATGQTIGIIELGGGYKQADLTAYFKSLGMPAPSISAVLVDKGKNAPSKPNSSDGEVMLDIEVCASVAPGAKIVVYFTPNTDQGFADAIATAVHDTTNKPSVISISWGGPESSWTPQAMTTMDSACQAAAALGVTITVASGDNGSTDGVKGTANHVDFPASSPHVLGCGGTKLVGSGTTITSEVVWNETALKEGAGGGGVSTFFPLPAWQKNANVPASTTTAGGRGVPDVSGDADPATGYTIRVDGQTTVIGGTSAVAPLWAGLIALANAQNKASAGFINPTIYMAGAKKAFNDITQGNNGGFSAGPGWDACTGLGSPVAPALIAALKPAATTAAKKAPAKKTVAKKAAKKASAKLRR